MKTKIPFLILLFLLIVTFLPKNMAQPCNNGRAQDSMSLVQLYKSTDSSNWSTKWKLNQPMSSWFGVTLGSGGRVVRLSLSSNNLSGKIPIEFVGLCALNYLNLSNNKLTDTVPALLSQMSTLSEINFSNNPNLTGQIPNFTSTSTLKIDFSLCNFKGVLPLVNSYYLFELNLSSNKIGGTISDNFLFSVPSVRILNLSSNQLTGKISPFFYQLYLVETLCLNNNLLTDTIPNSLTSMNKLQIVCLSNNFLTGIIPPYWGKLTQLNRLLIDNNLLTGTIPTRLDSLKQLEVLQLQKNKLSGTIPTTLGALPNLRILNVGINQLTGTIPASLGNDTTLIEIGVGRNRLTGNIPTTFMNLKKMEFLEADSNLMSGVVPIELTKLDKLAYLNISGNGFDSLTNFSASFSKYLSSDYNPKGFLFSKNKFTFDDILPNMGLKSKTGFLYQYAQQDSIICANPTTTNSARGATVSIALTIDGALTSNVYKWYKDNKLINATNVNKLILSNVQPCNSGNYSCVITNPLVAGMTLYCPNQILNIAEPFQSCEPYAVKAFPNPVDNVLTVQITSPPDDVRLIKVYNMLGQEILQKRFDEGNILNGLTLDCTTFPNGSYFLSLYTEGGTLSLTKRIQLLKKG